MCQEGLPRLSMLRLKGRATVPLHDKEIACNKMPYNILYSTFLQKGDQCCV